MGFRLLGQLNEKEREYQELLRSSVCRKQEQIDALRTAAATTEGKMFKCWNVGGGFLCGGAFKLRHRFTRHSFTWCASMRGLETSKSSMHYRENKKTQLENQRDSLKRSAVWHSLGENRLHRVVFFFLLTLTLMCRNQPDQCFRQFF